MKFLRKSFSRSVDDKLIYKTHVDKKIQKSTRCRRAFGKTSLLSKSQDSKLVQEYKNSLNIISENHFSVGHMHTLPTPFKTMTTEWASALEWFMTCRQTKTDRRLFGIIIGHNDLNDTHKVLLTIIYVINRFCLDEETQEHGDR